jgi:hypothetical protein
MRKNDLSGCRCGLALLEPRAALFEVQLAPPERDGARRDDDDFLAGAAEIRDVRANALEPRSIHGACLLIHEQRRADLDDDAARAGEAFGVRHVRCGAHGAQARS